MSGELLALAVLILLQMAFSLVATAAVGQITGTKWLLGSRGETKGYSNTFAGRLDRARSNGFEALILFTPTVFVIWASGHSTSISVNAAWVFVVARVVYLICYGADLVPWRTIVWFVGWTAILVMLGGALFG